MNAPVQQAAIRQYAKQLQLRTIGGQFAEVAEQAIRQKQSHLSYLEALLGAEVEERDRNAVARRMKEAHFPKVKTLEDFAFSDAPHIPAALVQSLKTMIAISPTKHRRQLRCRRTKLKMCNSFVQRKLLKPLWRGGRAAEGGGLENR